MSTTRALVGKELRQHGGALGGLTALLALSWGLAALLFQQQARTLSVLELIPRFALMPLAGAALFLGHRLVVAENQGRTQRFLEALPISRGHLVLVKAALGLAWLWVWAGAALAAGVWLSRSAGEPIGGRFLAILALRLGLYVFALWGVVFLLGWFGRLRVLLALGLVMAVVLLDRQTAWRMDDFGPFALLAGETFAFERHRFPVRALLQAAAVGLAGFGAAWALARVREGSVAETLAKPLSARELSALVLAAVGVALAFSALDPDSPITPYAFTTDKRLRDERGGQVVEIAYFEDELRPPAERLLAELGPLVPEFARALGLPRPLPPVRLVDGPEVPPNRPDPVETDGRLGTVLRVNLAGVAAGEPPSSVAAHVLHQLIWARTRGRAGVENRHWLLDGFAVFFAEHGTRTGDPPLDLNDQTLRRALVAAHLVGFDRARAEGVLAAYYQTSERLGDDLTLALSASGWRVLQARAGRARTLALARAALARAGTGDVRDFLHDRFNPVPRLFRDATGWDFGDFLNSWTDALGELRARPEGAALLAGLPGGTLEIRAGMIDGIGVVGKLQAAPDSPRVCSLQHQKLHPFEFPSDPETLEALSFVWPAGEQTLSRFVTGVYGSGERAFVALDCDLPGLTRPVRLLAGRVTVR